MKYMDFTRINLQNSYKKNGLFHIAYGILHVAPAIVVICYFYDSLILSPLTSSNSTSDKNLNLFKL